MPLLACNGRDQGPIGTSFPTETQAESSLFDLLNQARREHGLSEASLDNNLTAVAREHSADMRDRNYFAHTSPDGQTFHDRLKNAGIHFSLAGEALSHTAGISNPAAFATNNFLNSKEHRDILLNPQFTRVGIGVARLGNGFWITEDFIKP